MVKLEESVAAHESSTIPDHDGAGAKVIATRTASTEDIRIYTFLLITTVS